MPTHVVRQADMGRVVPVEGTGFWACVRVEPGGCGMSHGHRGNAGAAAVQGVCLLCGSPGPPEVRGPRAPGAEVLTRVQTDCRSQGSQKQHTSMQRTMQAFACRPRCQRQRSQTAWVRRSVPMYARKKTKSPDGRVGLSAHIKIKNRLHREKEASCSPDYSYGCDCAVPATDILHQNFDTAYRGSDRLSVAGQSKVAHKRAKDNAGIPHADQAANPYTSECDDHRRRHANLARKSRQTKRFGSPFQAACGRLTLSVTSLCV